MCFSAVQIKIDRLIDVVSIYKRPRLSDFTAHTFLPTVIIIKIYVVGIWINLGHEKQWQFDNSLLLVTAIISMQWQNVLFKASVLEYSEFRHFPSEDDARLQWFTQKSICLGPQVVLVRSTNAVQRVNQTVALLSNTTGRKKKKTHCYHKVEQEQANYLLKFSGGLIT